MIYSTPPISFVIIPDGNWENDSIRADGQNAPVKSWSRCKIKLV